MAEIHGKIDCFSRNFTGVNATDSTRTSNETYVGLFKFLEDLQVKGITELITYFSGAGGIGTGKDYWDTADAAGSNAFSVWKFNPYKDRNWEWYLYIQNGGGTGVASDTPSNVSPSRLVNGSNVSNTPPSTDTILVQAAFSISGSSSINPWNGTFNLSGAAYKSTPVWTSGSPDYSIHVFPRINNLSGSAATEKDINKKLFNYTASGANSFSARYHFLSDGHGLLLTTDVDVNKNPAPREYAIINYIGPFSLVAGIKDAYPDTVLGGSGSFGFCMLSNATSNANGSILASVLNTTMPEQTDIGPVIASGLYTLLPCGGMFCVSTIGVRTLRMAIDGTTVSTTYQPNSFTQAPSTSMPITDERVYSIYGSESGFEGLAGYLDTPLIRGVGHGVISHDTNQAKTKIILGTNTSNFSSRKISIPWDGTTQPGSTFSRVGVTFSNTNYIP